MLNLRQIEVFHAIMRTGTITEAARLLNVTQPAISASLKQLEARMRLRLFDRVGGRLQPTPEAKALLPDVAEIFGRLGAVERYSQDLASGSRGVIAVAATAPLCDGFVAKAVATFVAQRPSLRVKLQSLSSQAVLDRVINREVDVGIVYEPVVSAAVRTDTLSRAPISCILPARHPLARRRTVPVHSLRDQPIITYLPQALLRPFVDRVLSGQTGLLDIRIEAATSATAIALAVHGGGVALVESSLFSSRPVPHFVLRPVEPRVDICSVLLRPMQGGSSRVLEDFVGHLRSVFPS